MKKALAKQDDQHRFLPLLSFQNNIPVFTVPMTVVALVFLLTTDQRGVLHRVTDGSYPEKQSYQWWTKERKIPQKDNMVRAGYK